MNIIDRFLNNITMYRLVLYALGILALLSLVFGFMGTIAYTVPQLLISLVLLVAISYGADYVCAGIWGRPRNPESALITALILFLILAPPMGVLDAFWLGFGTAAAIGSKYILSYKGKHVFNPAAMGALALTVLGAGITTWWVATPALFPALLVLGLLIVRKLRRFDLWFTFIAIALVVKFIVSASLGANLGAGLLSWVVSWPTLFFSTIMLTEPLTMPATKRARLVYAGITALLFSIPFSLGHQLYSTPQLALVIGNVFAFFVISKGRTRLSLRAATRQSESVIEYTFTPNRPLPFIAGQYAEWTLPHEDSDDRGVRRFFTFSSAPEAGEVRLAVRVGKDASSFKRALANLRKNGTLSISNIAGDFILPADRSEKLLFIAGGVGITPFISMIRSMRLRGDARDVVLLYAANSPEEFAFGTELNDAHALGLRTIPIPATAPPDWRGKIGTITAQDIQAFIPDVADRLTYISGPDGMVKYYKSLLKDMVPKGSIKTDYFPGL